MKNADVDRALKHLKENKIAVVPTESFYAFAVDATSTQALDTLVTLKGRPPEKPFPLLITPSLLSDYVENIPKPFQKLMDVFWPGPLTLVFQSTLRHPYLSGDLGVAFRYGTHPLSNDLIEALGRPITCTSANLSAKPSMTDLSEIKNTFDSEDLCYVDGGALPGGKPSTLLALDLSGKLQILREGPISREQIESII